MGERKGTNLYYPPDYDPRVGGLNKFMGTHALRERARKLHMGILIIRFEMPYNIWCEGCGNHIGMGVRYNAEKSKIGMYYSTPLYQFRMKCHLCDNHFEIKTDPANLDYVIVSGARRQEKRWDSKENEQVVPETKEVSRRLYDDAMYKLEHGVEDVKTARFRDSGLNSAIALNKAHWSDDYASNCALRTSFRARKKELERVKSLDQSLLKKAGLDMTLVQEHKDDIEIARLLTQNKRKDPKEGSTLPLKRLISVVKSKQRQRRSSRKAKNLGVVPRNVSAPSATLTTSQTSATLSKSPAVETLSGSPASASNDNGNVSLVSYTCTSSDSDT